MNKKEFIESLAEILMADPSMLRDDDRLDQFSAWDSMGQMAVLAMIDEKVGTTINFGALEKVVTVGDVVALVKGQVED